jgi:glutamine---fructose-6-phosphate transaminase (isomerizing)
MDDLLKQEILSQPEAVAQVVETQRGFARLFAEEVTGSFDQVLIAARGTSDNAARYATYLLGARNRLPVALAVPSLYTLYQSPPRLRRTLVIGISQSGQSPDIVQVVEDARRQGQPTLAITNDAGAPLARSADYVLALNCGKEQAVAATKTYTTSLAAVALLSAALAQDAPMFHQLEAVSSAMREAIEHSFACVERLENANSLSQAVVIGRGYNYATAFEIALKIKELTGIITEPYSPADFRHGPIAMVRPGFPVILVAPSGAASQDLLDLTHILARSGVYMIAISDQPKTFPGASVSFALPAGIMEWLSPLVAVLPGQVIARHIALARGLDPNAPTGLTKVTHTW